MPHTFQRQPYSYRQDPAVLSFPDDRPLFIFDGVCVLCSGGAAWLMHHDKSDLLRFVSAQSALGQTLYRHYNLDMDATYLVIDQGVAYTKSRGYLHMLDILGGWWILLKVCYLIPNFLRDFIYDMIARNRYKWFGKTEYCALIPNNHKSKLL